jgi:Xaa-Pro aminopeptidase
MKRGLVVLDPQEIPVGEIPRRVRNLQNIQKTKGITLALIYGDVYHSGDITYLSNLCIYWNEGVLAVPVDGNPAFLTKLSRRVFTWMKKESTLEDLRSGQNLGELVKEMVKGQPAGTIGLIEMDWWPSSLIEQLTEKLPDWKFENMGPAVKIARQHPSESEMKLLKEGATVTARAVQRGMDGNLTNDERAGLAEREARLSGVEDVFVYCNPATEDANTVEIVSEYRGYWTLASRVVYNSTTTWELILTKAYEKAVQMLRTGVNISQLRNGVNIIMKDQEFSWSLDVIHHTDLETHGDFRYSVEHENPLKLGAVVGMRLQFTFSDGTRAVIADTFEINEDTATCLTQIS